MAAKPTIADLMAEIEALKRKVAMLEARPLQVSQQHHHYHQSQPLFVPQPARDPLGPPFTITANGWCAGSMG